MSEQKSNTTCIVVGVLGGLGCLGALAVIGAAVAVLFLARAAPAPAPVATAAPPSIPTDEAIDTQPYPAEPDAGEIPPDIDVETKHENYVVRGTSAQALKDELGRLGPKDQDGSHHAYTRWHVRWTYPYERKAGSCGTGPVKVSVTVTYIMPEWTPPPEAPADLVGRWNRYHTALQRHEDGHKEHGLGAAREVREKLRTLDAEPDCDSMNREANAVANRVVEQYKAKDKTFDKETRHGANQGARFP